MITLGRAAEDIKQDEGYSRYPYYCTGRKLTIGYGRNIEETGISEEEARFLLKCDVQNCLADLSVVVFPRMWVRFPEAVQSALVNMRFQLGEAGFRGFKNMIAAVRREDWPGMIREMKDSVWYREQTPERAQRQVEKVESVMINKRGTEAPR